MLKNMSMLYFMTLIQECRKSEAGEDEIDSSKPADEVPKVFTENFTEERATGEVELGNPVDKVKIPGEWRQCHQY